MSNKRVLFFILLIFLTNCGKKANTKLAESYYKMSVLELSGTDKSNLAYKKALNLIDKAIEQDDKPEYLAFKATLLFKLNQKNEGEQYFQKALHLNMDPKNRGEILNNRACLLAQLGIDENQQEAIGQAFDIWSELEHDKDYLTPEAALFNQGKVYIEQKKFIKAQEKFTRAIYVSPGYLDAHYYQALVAYKLNDLKLAKSELATVLFLEPDHKGATELQEILQK